MGLKDLRTAGLRPQWRLLVRLNQLLNFVRRDPRRRRRLRILRIVPADVIGQQLDLALCDSGPLASHLLE